MVILVCDNLNLSVTRIIETGGQPSPGLTQPTDRHRSWFIE